MLRNLPKGRPINFIRLIASFTVPVLVATTTPLPCLSQQGAADGGSTNAEVTFTLSKDEYTLGPGDRVRIDVLKLTQFSGEFQVLADGSLNLPQVGSIFVTGMTLKEAAKAISEGYAQILKYPVVSVNVLTPA